MKNKKKFAGIIIAATVVMIALAAGILMYNNSDNVRLKKQLDLGNRCLAELNYEEAVIAYEAAIEIEPMNVEAYLGLAEAYLGLGDAEQALVTLERGYEVTGDERLKERIDEYVNQRKIKEQEEAEAVQREEIKQFVESDEFQEKVMALITVVHNWQNITDAQVRELCWSSIEVLERYMELYPENGDYYRELQELYFLVGEYELCIQIRGKLHELLPDNSYFWSYYKDEGAELIRDEYGRIIKSTAFYYDGNDYKGKQVEEYEYGQNGKMIRSVGMNDSGKRGTETVISTWTKEYEYDSEGRLSKITDVGDNWGPYITVYTFEYSGGGFTLYENGERDFDGFHEVYRITRDYVVNEYGKVEMVGEPMYEKIQ